MQMLRLIGHVVLSLLITAAAASAAPIFTQSGAPDSAFPSEREFDTLIADDFALAADDVIRSVSWLGSYAFDGTAPAIDDFQIRFYADAAGSPGALLQSFAVGDVVARAAVGMLGPFITYRVHRGSRRRLRCRCRNDVLADDCQRDDR